jgi:hypothetical protein
VKIPDSIRTLDRRVAQLVVVTVLYWVVLVFRVPLYTFLPAWHWQFIQTPLEAAWLIPALFLACLVTVYLVMNTVANAWAKLVLLILLGSALQFGFGFLEGRGIESIRDRMANTGHAEFAEVAVERQGDLGNVLSNYERLVTAGELGEYAKSKPPGQIVLYLLTQSLADFLMPRADREGKLDSLRTLASWTWPVVCYLVVIPLFFIARELIGEEGATMTSVFYLVVPSVNLITLHTDQVFFPLFFVASIGLSLLACSRRNPVLCIAAGIALYLAGYFTFALLTAIPFQVAICVYYSWQEDRGSVHLRRFGQLAGCTMSGFVLVDVLFRLILNYNWWQRYATAIEHHLAWNSWEPGIKFTFYFAFLNTLEFCLWLGVPLFFLCCLKYWRSIKSILRGEIRLPSILSIILLAVLVILALFGKTKGEVARLWLFLVPLICLNAAAIIPVRFPRDSRRVLYLVVILQLGTTLFIKTYQDFW